jgi:hypothetical protein
MILVYQIKGQIFFIIVRISRIYLFPSAFRASPRVPNKVSQSCILGKNGKTHLQRFPIPPPNLSALGKIDQWRGHMRVSPTRVSIGQSKGGRTWKRIKSRKGFLMQTYKRERIYKSG